MVVRLYGTAALAGLALAACVSGCSGSSRTVTVSDFAAGPCQQAAPAVLQIGRLVSVAHKEHGVRPKTQQEFTAAQSQLRHMSEKPPGTDALVISIGFLRLRLDSHTFDSRQLTDVAAAQQTLQRACTARMAH